METIYYMYLSEFSIGLYVGLFIGLLGVSALYHRVARWEKLRCRIHPEYTGFAQPSAVRCDGCWRLWVARHPSMRHVLGKRV
jgi:hypothetical protein